MQRLTSSSRFAILLFVLLYSLVWGTSSVSADSPPRQTTITISYIEHEWWLIKWYDNTIFCRIFIDHEGLPTSEEVSQNCGFDTYQTWIGTPPCNITTDSSKSSSTCLGVYLHKIGFSPKQKDVIITLPDMSVSVSLDGCEQASLENHCPELPHLFITAEEPLPNYFISNIEGNYNGLAFSCPGASCLIPLQATPLAGESIEFWATSSFGDTSPHYTARVRVIDTGVANSPERSGWYVDVLSSQWKGAPLASCAQTWQTFPPVGSPPSWLSTPEHSDLIASDQPYYYLAGRLIKMGVVNAVDCPSGGLLPNGYANTCGLEKSRQLVEEWQNKFDDQIIQTAQEYDVPAQLMKNLFAQESQFWPGVFKVPYEYGLGQLTENGADTLLLWDANFFNQFCPLVLYQDACDQGYLNLQEKDQAILRGALALTAKSDCSVCPTGIDLTNVYFSLGLFASTIKANCDQVAQIVYNASLEMPGEVSNYEDLWRFTLANYHAGPGCLSFAIYMAYAENGELTWENVTPQFTEPCQGVIPYVEKIAR